MTGAPQANPPAGPRQLVLFLLTGIVNAAVGYAAYAVLIMAGLNPAAALVISYAVGILWNFYSHGRFVFGSRGLSRFGAYVLTYLAILGANYVLLRAMMAAGAGPLLAQALLTPVMALLAFLLIGRVFTGRFPSISRPGRR